MILRLAVVQFWLMVDWHTDGYTTTAHTAL